MVIVLRVLWSYTNWRELFFLDEEYWYNYGELGKLYLSSIEVLNNDLALTVL